MQYSSFSTIVQFVTHLKSFRVHNDTPIVNKQGRLLTTEAEQEARWADHHQQLKQKYRIDVSTAPPEKDEIMTAIRFLKHGQAPGQYSLNAELFKAKPELTEQVLQPLFAVIWEEKQLSDDWKEGVILKNLKKGALSNCNNWRGVTFLSVPSKILAKLIIWRISEAVD